MAILSKLRSPVLLSFGVAVLAALIFLYSSLAPDIDVPNAQQSIKLQDSEAAIGTEGGVTQASSLDNSGATGLRTSRSAREFSEADLLAGVSLRERHSLGVGYPESFADAYDTLVAAAEAGDADSAFILYKSLNRCRNHRYATDGELESAIQSMHQTHTTISRAATAEHLQTVDPTATEQYLRQEHNFCRTVPQSYLDHADDWRGVAANAGNLTAQMELGMVLQGTAEGTRYLEMAWLQGNFDALAWIAKEKSRAGDRVSAYAYQLAYDQLSRKDFQDRRVMSGPSSDRWMEADQKALADAEFGLSPQDRQQAMAIAVSLVQSNERCCFQRNLFHVSH